MHNVNIPFALVILLSSQTLLDENETEKHKTPKLADCFFKHTTNPLL